MRPFVHLVCGPPGAGKSTYVAARKSADDLVWDYDRVMEAITMAAPYMRPLGASRYVLAMREAFFTEAALKSIGAEPERVWVIATLPRRNERAELAARLGATVVVLAPTKAECLERVAVRARDFSSVVNRWFQEYEP
jgi:predicted kinase